MKYRFSIPVGGIPVKAQGFQQGSRIPETGTDLPRLVGIGTDGEYLTAAFPIEFQNIRPFFDGFSLGGVEFNALALLH